jgi:hypothetical protein
MSEFEQKIKQAHEIQHQVASTETLIKAGIVATVIASIILVVAILPAEYGIDPTGLGESMNLTQLANPQVANVETALQTTNAEGLRKDVVDIKVSAGSGLEYKFRLAQYDKLRFNWKVQGDEVFYDFHGEPDGDTTGFFESYAVVTWVAVKGTLTAPLAGSHGWYGSNESDQDVTITLQSEGNYEIIGVK